MGSMATGAKIGMGAVGIETAPYAKKYFELTNYHFELTSMDRDHLVVIDADLLKSTVYETRDGAIPGLAPEDMLCHLAYHAWWDTQSLGNIINCRDLRVYQLADIRLFLLSGLADIPSTMRRARELGCVETTNWALVVVGNLWDDVRDDTTVLDASAALEFDARVADRWLQRDTSSPMIRWDSPAWERVRDPQRGDWALRSFFEHYITAHTRRGDVLSWVERG